jgi:tRNA threonylcarbamoyladenosine biosynthesis protein TsaB
MKILAVETATSWQSVAVLDDGRILARREQSAAGLHGMLLLPAIDHVLKDAGLRLTELDGLACSVGPGSFTGIRVGVSTCLGLRAATDLPIALVPTLEAMAWNVKGAAFPLCPVLTSRKGEVYWAIFRWTGEGRLERVLVERVGSPDALARSLTEKTTLFGEGWSAMESDIRAVLPAAVTVEPAPEAAAKPSAVAVGMIGVQRLRQGEIAGHQVTPLYVQRAEAEIRFEQAGGVSPVARRQERVTKKVAERMARDRQRRRQPVRTRNGNG